MRVEGMDAKTINLPKINTGDNSPSSNDTSAVKEGKSGEAIPLNISQISEVDRRELPISEQVIINAIEKANKAVSLVRTNCKFSIHEKTNEIMVKVIDSETNQVIREIPPEKILDLVAKLCELAGLIVDEKR